MSSGSSLSINNERFLQPLPPSPHRYTSAAGYSKVAHLLEAPISVQAPQFAYTKKKEKQKHDAAGVIKECLNETTLHQMRAFISRWKVEEETRKSSSLLLLLLFVEMHFSELPRLRSFFWFCDVVSCTPPPSVFSFLCIQEKRPSLLFKYVVTSFKTTVADDRSYESWRQFEPRFRSETNSGVTTHWKEEKKRKLGNPKKKKKKKGKPSEPPPFGFELHPKRCPAPRHDRTHSWPIATKTSQRARWKFK